MGISVADFQLDADADLLCEKNTIL